MMKSRWVLAMALASVGAAACNGLLGINPLDGGTDANDDASTGDFALTVGAQRITIVRGRSAQVSVSIAWSGGVGEAVTVTASGLPTGVSADPVMIPAGSTSGTLDFDATTTAMLTVTGTATITATAGGFTHEVAVPVFVQDPPGTLDVTFGTNGVAVVPIPSTEDYTGIGWDGVAIQPDGSIVVCGNGNATSGLQQIILGRLSASGSADPSFGTYGHYGFTIMNAPGHSTDVCFAVKVLSSGKIAMAGFAIDPGDTSGAHAILAARVDSSGHPDPTFGNAGFVTLGPLGVDSKANAMVVDPNGNLVLGGFSGSDAAFLRLLPDGGLDPSFGDGGTALFAKPSGGGATAMGILPDGDILSLLGSSSFFAMPVTSSGALDATYGMDGGAAASPPKPLAQSEGLALQSDGKAVVAGAGGIEEMVELARFDKAGAIDPSFGDAGLVATSIHGGSTVTGNAVATPDGHVVVAMLHPAILPSPSMPIGPTGPIGVIRYDATGALDTTFNGAGYATLSRNYTAMQAAVAIDGAGRIVVAAFTTAATTPAVVVGRFWP